MTPRYCKHFLAVALVLIGAVVAPQSLYAQCIPPPSGMVAWWPLDEAAGPTANDIATGGVNNAGTWIGAPAPVTGKVGGALSFSGANSVDVPDHAELNFGTGDFSIDFWIKTTNSSGTRTILDKRTGSVPNITGYVLFMSNGNLGSQIGDGAGYNNCVTTGFVADGNWHHVALTVDRNNSSGWRHYVDGNAVGTPANPTGWQGSLTNLAQFVMARELITPSNTFAGTLDEVELFNRVLDSSEIRSIWAADSLGKCKDTCHATGDANNDGVPLTVGDMSYLAGFINGGGPAPVPLYSCDLNGDGFVNSADLQVYQNFFLIGIIAFAPYGGYPVQCPCNLTASLPVSIGMMHDSAFVWRDGRPLAIDGWYTINEEKKLVADIYAYVINTPMPAKSVVLLNGDALPEQCFGGHVNIYGRIDSLVTNPYPYWPEGDTLLIYFHVTGYKLLSGSPPWPYGSPVVPRNPDSGAIQEKAAYDPCKFAILLSGGVSTTYNNVWYRNVLSIYYHEMTTYLGYDPNNVYVLYFNGWNTTDPQPTNIPPARIFAATIQDINSKITTITSAITVCKNGGNKPSLFLMTFNHGQEFTGSINLVGNSVWPILQVRDRMGEVLQAGCTDLYVVMGQCFGGFPARELQYDAISPAEPTTMYVTANSNKTTWSWSDGIGDPYLEKVMSELVAGKSFEVAMVEACKVYDAHLAKGIASGQVTGTNLVRLQASYAEKYIVWKRQLLPKLLDVMNLVGFPDGRFMFHFEGAPGPVCGNAELYYQVIDIINKTTRVAHWNYNIPGYGTDYKTGNEWRNYCVPTNSTGDYKLVSQSWNGPFIVTVFSNFDQWHPWPNRETCVSSPSNIAAYAGFGVGWTDASAAEFGNIVEPFHSISDVNLIGFDLSEMPQRLGPSGVTVLDVTFPIPEYNEFWTDMEFFLEVAEVITPGNLILSLPGLARADTSIYIDHSGTYSVHVGAVPDVSMQTITFDASGTNLEIDAWGLASRVVPSPCGDANGDGSVDISDAVYLIAYIFSGGSAPNPLAAGDANCDGGVDISDAVYLISYIFSGGAAPCAGCK